MKRKILSVSLLAIFIGITIVVTFPQKYATLFPNFRRVRAIGSPDAYGNVIEWFAIYQWNTTHWVLKQNVTTDSPWTQRVEDDKPINFTASIRLNLTLASDNNEAISFTRIYCNITNGGSIWNNAEFNNTAISSDANYYYLTERGHWNSSGYPVAGTDYNVTIQYWAYY